MKICAISDIHGNLVKIDKCDILLICGDSIPLYLQSNNALSEIWYAEDFAKWVKELPCKKVIMIAGNHDFWLFYHQKEDVQKKFDKWYDGKVIYLQDSEYNYNGFKIYGCPWCEGPVNWAFCPPIVALKRNYAKNKIDYNLIYSNYKKIPDCDILLTHQPANVDSLGTSYFMDEHKKRNFGSQKLYDIIKERKIKYNFCGHIHTGDHNRVTSNKCDTVFYNVSLLNEQYELAYSCKYIEI